MEQINISIITFYYSILESYSHPNYILQQNIIRNNKFYFDLFDRKYPNYPLYQNQEAILHFLRRFKIFHPLNYDNISALFPIKDTGNNIHESLALMLRDIIQNDKNTHEKIKIITHNIL